MKATSVANAHRMSTIAVASLLGMATAACDESRYRNAYQAAYERAYDEVYPVVYAQVWSKAFAAAEALAAEKTTARLLANGQYGYHRRWLVVAVGTGAAVGFIMQFVAFRWLRRRTGGRDVDRSLLRTLGGAIDVSTIVGFSQRTRDELVSPVRRLSC